MPTPKGGYARGMYRPPAFQEDRLDLLHDLIRAHPLGLLITGGAPGLLANPIPFDLLPGDGGFGTLRGHLARANPQLEALAASGEALVVFQGPHAYVSPASYPSKRQHGRVVPTWNYIVVQARGEPRLVEDAGWLRAQVDALTLARERGRASPWGVGDAPDDFVSAQLRGIVGLELPITRLEGKWKVSQNRSAEDRAGVAADFARDPATAALAHNVLEARRPD